MNSLKTSALAGLVLALLSTAALAADLGYYPPVDAPPDREAPIDLGTGWYLRGDASYARVKAPLGVTTGNVTPVSTGTFGQFQSASNLNSWSGSLGVGYKLNSWFRADATFEYLGPLKSAASTLVVCPYQLIGLTSQTQLNVTGGPLLLGYAYNSNDTCHQNQSAKIDHFDALVNGYFDLGSWYGITPYVGAGAGTAATIVTGNLHYLKTSDNTAYAADLSIPTGNGYPLIWIDPSSSQRVVPAPNVNFNKQNWDRVLKARTYRFAFALMAGIAVDIAPHTKLDIGYRYLDLGAVNTIVSPATGAIARQKQTAQEVRIGFRYTPDL